MAKLFSSYILSTLLFNFTLMAEDLDAGSTIQEIQNAQVKIQLEEEQLRAWECNISSGSGKPTNILMKQLDGSTLCKIVDDISVFTSSGIFTVRQNPFAKSWALSNYTSQKNKDLFREYTLLEYSNHPLCAMASKRLATSYLNEHSKDIVTARRLANGKVELIFKYELKRAVGGRPTGTSAIEDVLVFDPAVRMLLVAHNSKSTGGPAGTVTYRMSRKAAIIQGKLEVQSITYGSTSERVKNEQSSICKFQYYHDQAPSPKEFNLEYYGLTAPPEPDDVYEDRGTNWPLWGGLGVVCVILSLFFTWFLRRRNRLKAEG